jgi:prolyl oligopeptidase family protein
MAGPAEHIVRPGIASEDGNIVMHRPASAINSPDGKLEARMSSGLYNVKDPETSRGFYQVSVVGKAGESQATYPTSVAAAEPCYLDGVGWTDDSVRFIFLEMCHRITAVRSIDGDGVVRTEYQEEARLGAPDERRGKNAVLLKGGGKLVVARSTNLTGEELVSIDLETRGASVLHAPNRKLDERLEAIAAIRHIKLDGLLSGRLYEPLKGRDRSPPPLVIALYKSVPGLESSMGDELPILALVEKGIAVFTLGCHLAGTWSQDGDFRFEIVRVERPLRAMEQLVKELASEGVIDRKRVGLVGLSYGSEIAMYAYWKSSLFRAISSATTSLSPYGFFLGGLGYAVELEGRGLKAPGADSYPLWKQVNAALNARPDLPPLLLQSPDNERYINVETWFVLKKAGMPVDWYEYPSEGHLKDGPANKWWVYQRNMAWFRYWLQECEEPDAAVKNDIEPWRAMVKGNGKRIAFSECKLEDSVTKPRDSR